MRECSGYLKPVVVTEPQIKVQFAASKSNLKKREKKKKFDGSI